MSENYLQLILWRCQMQAATVSPKWRTKFKIFQVCIYPNHKKLDICRNRFEYLSLINSQSKRLSFDDLVSPNYLWRTFPRYLNVRDSSKERRKICSQTFHTSPESKEIKNCSMLKLFNLFEYVWSMPVVLWWINPSL